MVVYPVERGSLTPLYLRTNPEVENKKMTERCIGPIANEIEPCKFAFLFFLPALLFYFAIILW